MRMKNSMSLLFSRCWSIKLRQWVFAGVSMRLKGEGTIALSVPKPREVDDRTGRAGLIRPNHFCGWNARPLAFLERAGFEVLSIREQPAGIAHTAQMINMALRTGLSQNCSGEAPGSFRDVMQSGPNKRRGFARKANGAAAGNADNGANQVCGLFSAGHGGLPVRSCARFKGTYMLLSGPEARLRVFGEPYFGASFVSVLIDTYNPSASSSRRS